MTTLLLIRHGLSEANQQRVFAGNYNAKLLETGYRQARETASYIAANYKVDAVYASDLQRAYETGKCIADAFSLQVIPVPMLREIRAGKWEGIPFDTIVTEFPEDYKIWTSDIGNSRCTDGESVKELGERVVAALTSIAEENEGKTVAVATHATPIRVAQCLLSKLSHNDMKNIPWVSNASVTEISYDNGEWEFVKIGEDSHLIDLKTTLPPNV